MKPLANPIVFRMALALVCSLAAFGLAVLLIRRLRKSIVQDSTLEAPPPSPESLALHTYHAVIQGLKQQKYELQTREQMERRRARTTENLSATLLTNLPCGVLFFNQHGLVKQANPAAKAILGHLSPVGLQPGDVFRGSNLRSELDDSSFSATLAEAVESTLRQGTQFRRLLADYVAPDGARRLLEVRLSPVQSATNETLGAACLFSDVTELTRLSQQAQRADAGSVSPELREQLHSSAATLAACARKLRAGGATQESQRLADDLVRESERLEEFSRGFSAVQVAAKSASGRN